MKRSFILIMAMIIAMAMLLSACAVTRQVEQPADTPEEPEVPAVTEPVEIRWASWENIYMAEEMAASFNERNPDIRVIVDDFGGWLFSISLIRSEEINLIRSDFLNGGFNDWKNKSLQQKC